MNVTEGRVNKIVAAIIFAVMLVVYMQTVAPTLSFWDCGEFIATSYIVGIPHPPGSPLLSLIGKVMSLVPFPDYRGGGTAEVAYRVNLIDVFLGALTVMLTYLIIVKAIRRFRSFAPSRMGSAVMFFSAAVAAFMVGFSDEFWNNAIETETYMPSLFLSMVAIWLAMRWSERSREPKAVRYIFLAAYLIGLGNGIHLSVLLAAPAVFLIVLATRPDWFADVKLWLITGLFLAGALGVKLFGGYEILYLMIAVFALVAPLVLYFLYSKSRQVWHATLIGIIFCGSLYGIGYSVYPTVMVRAAKSPAVNEGDPQTWDRYKSYLDREQYGQGNMYAGMFTRKADAGYQFGYMYARYLLQQFPKWGPALDMKFTNNRSADTAGTVTLVTIVPVSVFLLSLLVYGFYTHLREDWTRFFALMSFFLASGVGLVLYLNMDNPQVRERGYFFLGSYQIIMVWIGLGIYGVITDIREWLAGKNLRKTTVFASVALMAVFGTLPPAAALSNHLDPKFTNYEVHDRSDDWTPWDYAYNILISCDPDAILFTNGDNDTFPLWYLQEVKGVRKDVRVINLSLLNTDWYILQMKNEGKTVPIQYDEHYVRNVLTGKGEDSFMRRIWPVEGKEVTAAGITWKLTTPQKIDTQDGPVAILRVQDIMVYSIINWAYGKRPIYFAVTVAQDNLVGLMDHLSMEGMVYRLVPEPSSNGELQIGVAALERNTFTRYRYRGLSDPNNYISPNTRHLVTNYFIGFGQLAERYAALGDSVNAGRAADAAIEKTPNALSERTLLYQALAHGRMFGLVKRYVEREMAAPEWKDAEQPGRLEIYVLLDQIGERPRAHSLVQAEQNKAKSDVTKTSVWEAYIVKLYEMGNLGGALAAVDSALKIAPKDQNLKASRTALIEQILNMQPGGVPAGLSSR